MIKAGAMRRTRVQIMNTFVQKDLTCEQKWKELLLESTEIQEWFENYGKEGNKSQRSLYLKFHL